MDFSKYKKVKEDKHSTTLEAPHGTITLIHSKLPRIQVEQLKRLKMGDGGHVGLHIPGGKKKMAKGGPIKMSDGKDPKDAQAEQDEAALAQDEAAQPDVSNVAPTPAPPSNVAAQFGSNPPNIYAGEGQSGPVPDLAPYVPNIDPQTGQPNDAAISANQQAVLQNQGKINAVAGEAGLAANTNYLKAQAQLAQQVQQARDDFAGHVNDFAQHLQAVDPKQYINQMSGGQKAVTGLGLLLGGFTQGFTHGAVGNAAADWLNTQISRDIDAQKNAQDVSKTIYGAYKSLYGDTVATNQATAATMASMYDQMGKRIALQVQTPQSAVNAQNLSNQAAMIQGEAMKKGALDLATTYGYKKLAPGAQSPGQSAPQAPRPKGGLGGAAPVAPVSHAPTGPAPWALDAAASAYGYDDYADYMAKQKAGDPSMVPPQDLMKSAQVMSNGIGGESNNNFILPPDAAKAVQSKLMNDYNYQNTPAGAELQKEFVQAGTAEPLLKNVDALYDKLYYERNGLSGRLHRGMNTDAASAIGGAAPGVAGEVLGALGHLAGAPLNNATNQRYDRDKNSLLGILSGALSGRPGEFVTGSLDPYLPTSQDSKADVIAKREAFKQYIIDHVANGRTQLKAAGIIKK